ncbi:hypothetical protein ACSSS7_004500 [Eimeria intestinalis]
MVRPRLTARKSLKCWKRRPSCNSRSRYNGGAAAAAAAARAAAAAAAAGAAAAGAAAARPRIYRQLQLQFTCIQSRPKLQQSSSNTTCESTRSFETSSSSIPDATLRAGLRAVTAAAVVVAPAAALATVAAAAGITTTAAAAPPAHVPAVLVGLPMAVLEQRHQRLPISFEAQQAAKAFKASHIPEKEGGALRLAVQAEDALGHPLEAGHLLEQLGNLLLKHKRAARRSSSSRGHRSATAAAYEEGMECLIQAVSRFKAAGEIESAVNVLLRIAEKREQELSAAALGEAIKAFEDAVELRLSRDEQPHASEVYRHYICMLVRVGELKKAITITLRRLRCLRKLKQISGIHKSILTVTLLYLALGEETLADRMLSGQEALQNDFVGTAEFAAGAAAVDAYKARDGAALARYLESPVFRFLLPPVVALVAKLAEQACKWRPEFDPQGDEVGIPEQCIEALIC